MGMCADLGTEFGATGEGSGGWMQAGEVQSSAACTPSGAFCSPFHATKRQIPKKMKTALRVCAKEKEGGKAEKKKKGEGRAHQQTQPRTKRLFSGALFWPRWGLSSDQAGAAGRASPGRPGREAARPGAPGAAPAPGIGHLPGSGGGGAEMGSWGPGGGVGGGRAGRAGGALSTPT